MPPPSRSRRVELAVGVGVCVAGAMLVYAMLLAQGVGVRDELMLAAPEAARPGETIALRAYLFHDPDAPTGPTPEDGEMQVTLRDGTRELGRVTLAPGLSSSREGAIDVPQDARGDLYLVARARVDGSVVATVARPLHVADDAPPAEPVERVASALSRFSLGPLTLDDLPPAAAIEPGTPVPAPPHVDTLDARVVGGICIPEVRCILAVDLGVPSIEPRLSDCTGVEILPPLPMTDVASRYHVLPLVVHGPEGACTIDAVSMAEGTRGARLAHRAVRFPVALATPFFALQTPQPGFDQPPRYAAVAPPGRDGIILDVFRDGRWCATRTLPASSDPSAAQSFQPIEGLDMAGDSLLEARSDALPTTYVAPRLLRGRRRSIGGPALDPEMASMLYGLAADERDGLTLPPTVSGLADDRARLEARKRIARTIAFVGMTVGILLLVVTVLRRGLVADAEARAVMAAAGVPGANDESAKRRGRLTVLLMVLALGLACATGAALVAAHDLALDTSAS